MTGTQDGKVPSDMRIVRTLMLRAGLDEQSAARALEIEEATMQGYASGAAVPRRIVFALMQLADLGLTTEVRGERRGRGQCARGGAGE